MEAYCDKCWTLVIEYGSKEIDGTEVIEVPYFTENGALATLKGLVKEIAEDNKLGKNNDKLHLVQANIKFNGEINEILLKGATWSDVKGE